MQLFNSIYIIVLLTQIFIVLGFTETTQYNKNDCISSPLPVLQEILSL